MRQQIERGETNMPIFLIAAAPMSQLAEGCILGASVYLVSRGYKNFLRIKKK